ncbi:MAG TPA: hypothetical protein DIW31_12505 [Bacteroidales bacterium]|nr:hypothetical protein [Bacteroidales bacterium]
MEKKLIYKDKEAARREIVAINGSLNVMNEIANSLLEHGIKKIKVSNILEGVERVYKARTEKIEALVLWLKELRVKELDAPKIEGIEINKEKLIEMVELKTDVQKLFQLVNTASALTIDYSHSLRTYLKVDSKGVINPIDNYRELIIKKHSKFANANQLEITSAIEELIKSLNKIHSVAEKKGVFISGDINYLSELPYLIKDDTGYHPSTEFISKF